MWMDLETEVAELFAEIQVLDSFSTFRTAAKDVVMAGVPFKAPAQLRSDEYEGTPPRGRICGISAEAREEAFFGLLFHHERHTQREIDREFEQEDNSRYMRDFMGELVKRQAAKRAAERTAKRTAPVATCIHNGGGCNATPEPGRKMCRHHLDLVAAAMRASRQRKRAAVVAGAQ